MTIISDMKRRPSASGGRPESNLTNRLRGWRLRRRYRAELDALGDRGLAELGLHRNSLPALVRSRATNETLDSMLDRLGHGNHPYLADRAYRRTLERTCATCPATRACRRWLSHGGPADGYRRFCPNAFEFDLMDKAAGRPCQPRVRQ